MGRRAWEELDGLLRGRFLEGSLAGRQRAPAACGIWGAGEGRVAFVLLLEGVGGEFPGEFWVHLPREEMF